MRQRKIKSNFFIVCSALFALCFIAATPSAVFGLQNVDRSWGIGGNQGGFGEATTSTYGGEGRYQAFRKTNGALTITNSLDFSSAVSSDLFRISKTGESATNCTAQAFCPDYGSKHIDWTCNDPFYSYASGELKMGFVGAANTGSCSETNNSQPCIVNGTKTGIYQQPVAPPPGEGGYCYYPAWSQDNPPSTPVDEPGSYTQATWGRNLEALIALPEANYGSYNTRRVGFLRLTNAFDLVMQFRVPAWPTPQVMPRNMYTQITTPATPNDQSGISIGMGVWDWDTNDAAHNYPNYGQGMHLAQLVFGGPPQRLLGMRKLDAVGDDSTLQVPLAALPTSTSKLRIVRLFESGEWRIRGYYCPNAGCTETAVHSTSDLAANTSGWTKVQYTTGYGTGPQTLNNPTGRDYLTVPAYEMGGYPYILVGYDKYGKLQGMYLPQNYEVFLDKFLLRYSDGSSWTTKGSWRKTITATTPEWWEYITVDAAIQPGSTATLTLSPSSGVTCNISLQSGIATYFPQSSVNGCAGWTKAAWTSTSLQMTVSMSTPNQDASSDQVLLNKVTVRSVSNSCQTDADCAIGQPAPYCDGNGALQKQICYQGQCAAASAQNGGRVNSDGDGVDAGNSAPNVPYPGCDCNDNDNEISPLLEEACDTKDNDCNGLVNDGLTCSVPPPEPGSGVSGDYVKVVTRSALRATDPDVRDEFSALSPQPFAINDVQHPGLCLATPSEVSARSAVALIGHALGRADADATQPDDARVGFYKGWETEGPASSSVDASIVSYLPGSLSVCTLLDACGDTNAPCACAVAGVNVCNVAPGESTCSYETPLQQQARGLGCPVGGWSNRLACAEVPAEASYQFVYQNNVTTADVVRVSRTKNVPRSDGATVAVTHLSNGVPITINHGPKIADVQPQGDACVNSAISMTFDKLLDGSWFQLKATASDDGKLQLSVTDTYPFVLQRACQIGDPTSLCPSVLSGWVTYKATSFVYSPLLKKVVMYPDPDDPATQAVETELLPQTLYRVAIRPDRLRSQGGAPLHSQDFLANDSLRGRVDIFDGQLSWIFAMSSANGEACRVDRIELTPTEYLFTRSGQAQNFDAVAYSASGNPLNVGLVWRLNKSTAETRLYQDQAVSPNRYTLTALGKEGSDVLTVSHDNGGGESDIVFASANLRTIICNNPFGLFESSANDHFETYLCRDGSPLLPTVHGKVNTARAGQTINGASVLTSYLLSLKAVNGAVAKEFAGKEFDGASQGVTAPAALGDAALMSAAYNSWMKEFTVSPATAADAALTPDTYVITADLTDPQCTTDSDGVACGATLPTWPYYWRTNLAVNENIIDQNGAFNVYLYALQQQNAANGTWKDLILDSSGSTPWYWLPSAGETNQLVFPERYLQPGKYRIYLIWLRANGTPQKSVAVKKVQIWKGKAVDDALTIELFTNPEMLTAAEWYREHAPNPGTASAKTVDGYDAVQDGQSTYAAHTNVEVTAAGKLNVHPRILLVSGGITPAGAKLRQQLLDHMTFNTNVLTPSASEAQLLNAPASYSAERQVQFHNANKAALQKDWRQLHDLSRLARTLQSNRPTLAAGSYVPGLTFSTWPSWGGAFSGSLGASAPTPAANSFSGGCVAPEDLTQALYDPRTCWNARDLKFSCLGQPEVYAYGFTTNPETGTVGANMYLPMSLHSVGRASEVNWQGVIEPTTLTGTVTNNAGNGDVSVFVCDSGSCKIAEEVKVGDVVHVGEDPKIYRVVAVGTNNFHVNQAVGMNQDHVQVRITPSSIIPLTMSNTVDATHGIRCVYNTATPVTTGNQGFNYKMTVPKE